MSLSSIIRAVAGGPKTNTRAEGDKPEEDMEDDVPVTDDDENAEGDEPQDDENAEGDQPEEEDAEGDEGEPKAASWRKGKAAGRKAERSRMAAILGNPAADANPQLAAHLAFATDMKSADAVLALKASCPGAAAGGKLAGKMAGANQPRLGGSAAGAAGPQSQPERIAAHAAAIIEAKRAKRAR
ncbi:hypothetical protein [Hoeflea sp.]|uniref:hypothetical protein n=1 Tax=Hoeflea sp. TaxID=1940281 RepID=UPI00199CD206|nr:hypothetical protein [Hoeflea sp.]MBC7280029.1 hypothetical protein [Hoeflea sp.]